MKILKMQKRACRVILDYNVNDSHEAFRSLKILSVYDRLFLRKAKYIQGISWVNTPIYFRDLHAQK